MYSLYAGMYNGKNVLICDYSDINFLIAIAERFESSNNIERFFILDYEKDICYERVLEQSVEHRRLR